MAEFLGYGILIFIGLLVGLMLWRRVRGHGTGCCGECSDHGYQHEHGEIKNNDQTGNQRGNCH